MAMKCTPSASGQVVDAADGRVRDLSGKADFIDKASSATRIAPEPSALVLLETSRSLSCLSRVEVLCSLLLSPAASSGTERRVTYCANLTSRSARRRRPSP